VPDAAPRACPHAGCIQTRPHRHRVPDARPPRHSSPYDAQWQALRARKLHTDPICEIGKWCSDLPLVRRQATEVDHIVPIAERPDLRLAWWNLQSVCRQCHRWKTARDNHPAMSRPECFLVVGPPGSGKSTYVEHHRQSGDLVLDYDAIMSAISGLPVHARPFGEVGELAHWLSLSMFRAAVRELANQNRAARVWIVSVLDNLDERNRLAALLRAPIIDMAGGGRFSTDFRRPTSGLAEHAKSTLQQTASGMVAGAQGLQDERNASGGHLDT
jgi:5-methylcytosine-specific restriction endonuclease McrA